MDGRRRVLALAGAVVLGLAGPAVAQDAMQMRIIATSGPGSGVDILARLLGAELGEVTGQKVVVENRPGAGGVLGMQVVQNARADGSVIGVVAAAFSLNPSFYANLPFDTFKDFTAITLLGSQPNALIVPASSPAHTVKELIDWAKAKPGQLNYASSGLGTSGHLSMALFAQMAGISVVHVPYEGGGAATNAVVSGEVQMATVASASVGPMVKADKLRALGVTGAHRVAAMPDVPTVAESGLPGYDVSSWFGVVVSSRVPKPMVDKVYAVIAKAMQTRDMKAKLSKLDFDREEMTPAQFDAFTHQEAEKWAKVIASAGIKRVELK